MMIRYSTKPSGIALWVGKLQCRERAKIKDELVAQLQMEVLLLEVPQLVQGLLRSTLWLLNNGPVYVGDLRPLIK